MRAAAANFVVAAGLILLPVQRASAAGNPHNLVSCSACHPSTPQFGIDTRRSVTFTTSADDPGLCSSCHPAGEHTHPVLVDAGSGPPGARISAYLPAGTSAAFAGKVVCTSCHFIHAADTRYGLLRGFPGSPDPRNFGSVAAFCEECHGANLVSRSPHRGGAGSCVYCHAGLPQKEKQFEVAPTFMERCVICHRGVRDAHFAKLNPFGNRRECKLCHDQHAVAAVSPRLLSQGYLSATADSVEISPHFRPGLCLFCHTNTDDYALRDENVNALCNRCHASGKIRANIHPLRKVPPAITVPKGWPLTDGALTCLTCHDQGHEDQPRRLWMLHGGPYASPREVCRNCHRMTDLANSRLHQEINEGKSCEMCHAKRPQPGVDSIKTVSFIADPDLLCLRCHDQNAADGTVHHGGVIGREIEDGHILKELPLFNGRVICATCHNPHLREASGFRLREFLEDSNFCTGCHKS
ncbi:MAG: cytochrome c3 family protein [Candidatus Methylomirabilia bacterium]